MKSTRQLVGKLYLDYMQRALADCPDEFVIKAQISLDPPDQSVMLSSAAPFFVTVIPCTGAWLRKVPSKRGFFYARFENRSLRIGRRASESAYGDD